MALTGPSSATLGAALHYSAAVTGNTNTSVIWTVNGVAGGNASAGTLTADGVYTAPRTMPGQATVILTARSVANPSVSQSMMVTLAAPAETVIAPMAATTTASAATGVTMIGPTTLNLGTSVGYGAKFTGTTNQDAIWSVSPSTGAGSISLAGVYTPPAKVPSPNQVTIRAISRQTPTVAGSITVTLLNTVPVITSATAAPGSASGTYVVDVHGDGFVNGARLIVAGSEIIPTQVSASELRTTIARSSTTQVTVAVKNPDPGTTSSVTMTVPLGTLKATATAAARLLDQASFGPTDSTIEHVEQVGLQGYLNEQFADAPVYLPTLPASVPSQCSPEAISTACVRSNWFNNALAANDQLRQRVALALSEIWVASSYNGYMITPYANLLVKDAFTNYRQIMQDMTLSPNMGYYLNLLNSPAPKTGQIANENYGRELMQLFTIGPNLLNEDGTLETDSTGNSIPAYSQSQVQAMARAFTGWTYANADGSTPSNFIFTPNWNHLMVPTDLRHDSGAKTLLSGVTLPAGQNATADLKGALDNIFNHPNVGPFVCRQLIQRLVAGNPSPAYVQRVAAVFADNGSGVRGDMKAVITAILLDPEARANDALTGDQLATSPTVQSGHLREPTLWAVELARGLNAAVANPTAGYPLINMGNGQLVAIGDPPFGAPSVFGFFPPSYVIPQTSLLAPEFGLENTGSVIPQFNMANYIMHNTASGLTVDFSATGQLGGRASDPGALVDYLGMIFMHSQMPSDVRSAIVDNISSIAATNPSARASVAAYLVVTSPQYRVMH
jgi:uncharacterized protein (DUF1800 family)